MTQEVMNAYIKVAIFSAVYIPLLFCFRQLLKVRFGIQPSPANKPLLAKGIILFVLTLIFNFVYSRYFGLDHMFATSTEEWMLDIASSILLFVSQTMIYRSVFPKKKKKVSKKITL